MNDATELDDWEGLLTHPGWQRLMAKFQDEYGPRGDRYAAAVERAINAEDREKALAGLQVMVLARKEMDAFFQSIISRRQELLNRKTASYSPSRRGATL